MTNELSELELSSLTLDADDSESKFDPLAIAAPSPSVCRELAMAFVKASEFASSLKYAKAASLLLLELAVTSTVAVHSPAASDRRRLEAVCTRVTPEHTALESIDDIALHTPFVMESSTSFTFELTNVSSMFTRFTMTLKGSIVTGLGDGLGDGLGLGFEGALVVVGVEEALVVVGVEGALVTGVEGALVTGVEGALVTGVEGAIVVVGVEGALVTGVEGVSVTGVEGVLVVVASGLGLGLGLGLVHSSMTH